MDSVLTNKEKGLKEAVCKAAEALAGIQLGKRCTALGLPLPAPDASLRTRFLDRDVAISITHPENSEAHKIDTLLLLHYLAAESFAPAGEWVTFRQFPGGQFYWEPFIEQTVRPLLNAVNDDVSWLRKRLGNLITEDLARGDVSAAITVFGKVRLGIVYYAGDEEFGASFDILFDRALPRIFSAEDALGLAKRLCVYLSGKRCEPCSGCGVCDK